MTKLVQDDLTVLVAGTTGVTCFLGTVKGTFAGTPFAMRLRSTRIWVHTDEHGWRIPAAHASPAQRHSRLLKAACTAEVMHGSPW